MSSNLLSERSVVLHLEFSIADAVRRRGLVPVIFSAIGAWWAQQPRRAPDIPTYLRADIGLPAVNERPHWTGVDLHTFRLHPPDRSLP